MSAKTKDYWSAVTAVTYVVTFIVIGLPLWWKTTTVYRHPVPHDECREIVSAQVVHVVHAKLVLGDPSVKQGLLWEELHNVVHVNENTDSTSVLFDWVMRTTTDEEEKSIQLTKDLAKLDATLDNRADEVMHHGELEILILNKNFTAGSKFTIGRGRRGYIVNDADYHGLAEDVSSLVRTMAQVDLLEKLYISPSSTKSDNKPDKDRMRHLRASSAFDVTFTLIVPEPGIVDIRWDAETAIQSYISPFLEELSLISEVEVKSQVLYMTSLPIEFTPHPEGKAHVVHSETLATIINPVETHLGSDTSVHANLNFVIYIPTRQQTPLQIYDSENVPVKTNAFLSPQWGGFLVQNCLIPENASLPHKIDLDTHTTMEVFLSQFRLLMGLPEQKKVAKGTYNIIPTNHISKWELDFLLRKNAQEQLSVAISSLYSLSRLLQTIGNIVIKDDIGQKIYFALSSAKESLQLLKNGFLERGFLKSKYAFVASEEVFFDPSLLSLLYFPESQKYAIYTPLFLPVSIPVIISVFRLWQLWKNRKTKKED